MAEPRTLISIRLDTYQIEQLDQIVQEANAKQIRKELPIKLPDVTRSDIIRTLLERGILITASELETQIQGT